MNCHDVRTRLDHPDRAADGVLMPDILAHLEDCANCERYRERLAAIIDPSSVLPREVPPPRALWPGIAIRLGATAQRRIRSIPNFLPLAAAAGLAAVAIASLFSLPPRQSATVASVPNSVSPTSITASADR